MAYAHVCFALNTHTCVEEKWQDGPMFVANIEQEKASLASLQPEPTNWTTQKEHTLTFRVPHFMV